MSGRHWILISPVAVALSLLAGCSGGTTFNVHNPPPPPSNPVAISVTPTPQPDGQGIVQISLSSNASVMASVKNDPQNLGVDWELLVCQNGSCNAKPCSQAVKQNTSCGILYESNDPNKAFVLHSASQDTLIYQPPSVFPVPGNDLSIEILAFATADQTKNTPTTIQTTAFGGVLAAGTYVFQVQGLDTTVSSNPYQVAGEVVFDGNGNITSGQQTLNTTDFTSGALESVTGAITLGGYFVGTDGRGSMILNMTDQNGDAVEEDFGLVVLSSSKVLISQLGGAITTPAGVNQSTTPLARSGSGTMERQKSTAMPTGGLAFVAQGTDSSGAPISYGGVINVRADGTFSGFGNIVDAEYSGNTSPYIECDFGTGVSGTMAPGSSAGTVILTLNAPNCFATSAVPIQLVGYIADSAPNPARIQFIETVDSSGSASFLTAGPALGQVVPAGGFNPQSFGSASGQPYVFGALGYDVSNLPSTMTSANEITAVATSPTLPGTMTGFTDTFFQSISTQISDGFTANFQLDAHAAGRVKFTGFKFDTKRTPTFTPEVTVYLTGSQAPALVLYGAGGSYGPSAGIGIAYPQQANPGSLSFGSDESYGAGFAQSSFQTENDGTGQLTANPAAGAPLPICFSAAGITSAGLLAGCANNFSTIGASPVPLNDTFTLPADSFGRVAGTFMAPTSVEYYLIDSDHSFFVETDLVSGSTGATTLGYLAKACDVTGTNANNLCSTGAARTSRNRVAKRIGAR